MTRHFGKIFQRKFLDYFQIFSYSAVLFQDKAYVGGKGIDNKGGNVIDFIYQNG